MSVAPSKATYSTGSKVSVFTMVDPADTQTVAGIAAAQQAFDNFQAHSAATAPPPATVPMPTAVSPPVAPPAPAPALPNAPPTQGIVPAISNTIDKVASYVSRIFLGDSGATGGKKPPQDYAAPVASYVRDPTNLALIGVAIVLLVLLLRGDRK